ncbi:DMT family transporter [Isoptericola halotolerans]|uniref:Drug/metabolite transporter (DMT)-like permease n=1 Tax=Isoptericola halotolerans TaxID=300560 RepID=A0ABX2A489_9MICO|nr:DMT family transporter [Isoptericola halotolerans]NOV97479.1 drug/metabolite transporter (DMT)-like permease [Isoptericola halotolerans]
MTTTHPPATAPGRTGTPRAGLLTATAIAVTVLLWASAFVAIRAVGHHVDPGPLTLGRVAVGSVALTAMVLVVRTRRRLRAVGSEGAPHGAHRTTRPGRTAVPRGRVLLLVLVWGVAWFGAYNLTLNAAEQHLDAGTTALLVNIAPMLVAVLAGLVLGEGFPRRLLVGIAVAFAGVVVIAAATSSGRFDAVGVLLGLVSAVLYAGAATLQKRLLPFVDALTMTWMGCLAGTAVSLPFLPGLVSQVSGATTSTVLGIIYLGVFPTAIAFSTWGYVLTRASAGRTAATTYAVPAVVVLLSWTLLAEVPPPAALVGGVLALVGVAVATLPSRRRPPRPVPSA